MSYKNGKSYTDFRAINLKSEVGLLRFEDIATVPTSATGEYLLYVDGGVLYFDNGSSAVGVGAAGGSSGSLDGAYDGGRTITVNQGAVTLNGVNEDTAVLSIAGDGDSSGSLVKFAHTTATRNDVLGTGSTWKVTGQGASEFQVSVTTPAIVAYHSSGNGNLTIDAKGTGTITIGGTSTGAVTITPAVTLTASATITGTGGSTVFTVTAGDAVLSDGSLLVTDADNAQSFGVVNNTVTTHGAAAADGVVQFSSTSLTTGTLLHLELTEGTLNGGFYLKAWDVTAGAAVFTIGENGDVAITGTAAANAFTITGGDVLMSDGSLTMTDADNAASLSITNNTATTANTFLFTGSGVFTGTGASSFFNVTQSGATTGTVASVIANGLTTGTGLSVTSSGTIATTGELISFVGNSATTTTGLVRVSATALTDGWVEEQTGGGANFTASGGMVKLTMGASTVGTGLNITTTGVYTGTTGLIDINATSATTGVLIDVAGTGITTGTFIKLNATEATLTTGKYLEFYDGAANDFSVAKYGATIIAGNSQGTAALTVTAGDLVLTSGNATVGGKMVFSGTETIVAGGTSTALALTKTVHYVDADAGGDTFTLADGVAGQIMTILLTSSTGVATITPANLAGGTSVTLNADGDTVVLQFMDTEWFILGGNSYAVV